MLDEIDLHVACWTGDFDRAVALIEAGADVNKLDKYKRTPIHCACVNGHAPVVRFLCDRKAILSDKDNYGRTPLHCLALGGHVTATEIFCKKAKVSDIKEKDSSGRSAMKVAQQKGFDNIVRAIKFALREKGDNGDDDGEEEGCTPGDKNPTTMRVLPSPRITPRVSVTTTDIASSSTSRPGSARGAPSTPKQISYGQMVLARTPSASTLLAKALEQTPSVQTVVERPPSVTLSTTHHVSTVSSVSLHATGSTSGSGIPTRPVSATLPLAITTPFVRPLSTTAMPAVTQLSAASLYGSSPSTSDMGSSTSVASSLDSGTVFSSTPSSSAVASTIASILTSGTSSATQSVSALDRSSAVITPQPQRSESPIPSRPMSATGFSLTVSQSLPSQSISQLQSATSSVPPRAESPITRPSTQHRPAVVRPSSASFTRPLSQSSTSSAPNNTLFISGSMIAKPSSVSALSSPPKPMPTQSPVLSRSLPAPFPALHMPSLSLERASSTSSITERMTQSSATAQELQRVPRPRSMSMLVKPPSLIEKLDAPVTEVTVVTDRIDRLSMGRPQSARPLNRSGSVGNMLSSVAPSDQTERRVRFATVISS